MFIGALARVPAAAASRVGLAVGRSLLRPAQSLQLRAAKIANSRLARNTFARFEDRMQRRSKDVVAKVRSAARARGGQARLMVPTIEWTAGGRGIVQETQVGRVIMGGNLPVGRRGAPAYKLAFGSEFGSRRYKQFPPHHRPGYWFFRTVKAAMEEGRIAGGAADEAVRRWAGPTQQHD